MICENCGKTVIYESKLVIRFEGIEPVEVRLCRECMGNPRIRASYYHLAVKRKAEANDEIRRNGDKLLERILRRL